MQVSDSCDELRLRPLGLWGEIMQQLTKWYNQSNAINDKARAIRSKRSRQYGQQYNQNQLGSGYIISNIHANAKDLSWGLILGGCRKINSKVIPDSNW